VERETSVEALSDKELLARYAACADAGERAVVVQELFRRHYPQIIGWCLRFTGRRDEALDLAQAIFAKAYRNLASFRGEARISTWLYAIARSECMNFLKAQRAHPTAEEPGALEDLEDVDAAGPDAALERRGESRFVNELLDETLDATEKKVFVLHYGDDMPLDAVTRLLGLSNRSGAKAYIVSARRKLTRAVRTLRARAEALDA
jgi:RNA polymerase sigma factor (sigma-70 family)